MEDLKLIENNDGGDLVLNGSDLETVTGFQNMPYISMFGGNPGASTQEVLEGEQRFDWWGNVLFYEQTPKVQLNSELEQLLTDVALTSSSRIIIEETVKSDLKNMYDYANITVSVSIISVDRISINIKLIEPDNLESNEFIYIWDSTQNELITV